MTTNANAADREVWEDHTNQLGDWCPYSGQPVTAEDGDDDGRCPQGCAAEREPAAS